MYKSRSWKTIFIRNRLKLIILGIISFILYQLSLFNQLMNWMDVFNKHNLIRGTHQKQFNFYVPDDDYKFQCIESGEMIAFGRVNDNFCDCLDGTDEPGTNACPNGIFYCRHQQMFTSRYTKNFIPSSMVNDGICDCCDGSDEWEGTVLSFRLTGKGVSEAVTVFLNSFLWLCTLTRNRLHVAGNDSGLTAVWQLSKCKNDCFDSRQESAVWRMFSIRFRFRYETEGNREIPNALPGRMPRRVTTVVQTPSSLPRIDWTSEATLVIISRFVDKKN